MFFCRWKTARTDACGLSGFRRGLYFVLHGCRASDFVLHGGGVCVRQMRIFLHATANLAAN